MTRLCHLSVALWWATVAAGQSAPVMQPQPLELSSEKVLTVPAFGFFGPARSDSAGDVFIHPAPFGETHILKITSSSSETTVYKLPAELARKTSFFAYSVTPSGSVWVAAQRIGVFSA